MLTGRSIALFIHLLGVVTLFIAFALVQRGGAKVRSATDVAELRLWLGLTQSTRAMFPAAFLFLFGSGAYLTNRFWSFDTPWISVGVVSIIVMLVLGTLVVGRGFAAIGRAAQAAGAVTPEVRRLAARRLTWIVAYALNAMAMGMLWLMVSKPGWTGSVAIVAALAVVGALAGTIVARRPAGGGPATDTQPRAARSA
jgi:hypothetical protein